MKRLTAIFLLAVFLFNLIGYKVFYYYQIERAGIRLESRIPSLLSEDKLIVLKIPLKVPYLTESAHFEDAQGEMEINGVIYKYLKKKIEKDSLVMLCVDHREKRQLEKKSADYFAKVHDLGSKGKKKGGVQQVKTDFLEVATFTSLVNHFVFLKPRKVLFEKRLPSFCYLNEIPHPPESFPAFSFLRNC